MIQQSPLSNLKQYRVTLTTSSETHHGVSGHLFEMLEYFLFFRSSVCILLTDGTTTDTLIQAATEKYNLSNSELDNIRSNTIYHPKPKCIIANTIIVVDGSLRFNGCDIIAQTKILFRCADTDIEYPDWTVLQDNDIYEPLSNSVHYKKKILFSKYKLVSNKKTNNAMLYLTSNSRKLDSIKIKEIKQKYSKYNIIAISNIDYDSIDTHRTPVKNMWELFDAYIYTDTSLSFDCSPRLIMECIHYNKEVIFDIDYIDNGIETRLKDGIDKITLREGDEISNRI